MGEEHVLPITKLVNFLFAKPVLGLFALLHITPASTEYPIPNFFAMEFVVFAFAIVFFLWLRARMSVERPGATQQCMEFFLSNPMGLGVKDLLRDIVGHDTEQHVPLLGTIGMFILLCNLAALVPGFMSPTAEKTVPLACAVVVFLYYNYWGIEHHGPGYVKTLVGPVWWLAWLIVPVETISHFARMLSLTVRLWANMFVGELTYLVFLGLTVALFSYLSHSNAAGYISGVVPIGIPIILFVFHVFEAFLQAFIFTILSVVYVSLAVAEAH
jgi:F-type H+-transporting ATPase subunit a